MQIPDSLIIDYAILLVRKFSQFLLVNHFALDPQSQAYLTAINSQSFIISRHSLWEFRSALRNWKIMDQTLSADEKKLTLLILGMNLYSQNGINLWQASCFLHRQPSRAVFAFNNFMQPDNRLLRSGIVMVQETDFLKPGISLDELANMYNNKKVYLSPLSLNALFKEISGRSLSNFNILGLQERYPNVDVLLSDISAVMKYIFFISQFYKLDYPYSAALSGNMYEKGELARVLKKFRKNILKSGLRIELLDFLREHDLDNVEFVVLLYLIYRVIVTKESMINSFEEIFSHLAFLPSQTRQVLACFNRDSVFVKENFILQADFYGAYPYDEEEEDVESLGTERGSTDEMFAYPQDYNQLSIAREKIYRLLFSEAREEEEQNAPREGRDSRIDSSVGANDSGRGKGLFEIVQPTVTIESVILDDDVKKELLGAVDLTKAAETMKKWGIKPNLSSRSFGSIKILLYGASGTGKTITAQALAGEAGAELFKVDASNLVSSWVGESTKNVKKVFREYYRYAKSSSRRVFLFMNEADQLLSARGTIMQAADKEYNQMQNILLEELENFDGVFLATTNLVDLFDSAWNRRFNIKIRFDIPKYETRLKLWKVHISENMPISEDVNFYKLAEYELAGGSIANVVYNAARRAALREGSEKMVGQQDFLDAIQNETKSNIGGKAAKVGFGQ